MAASLPEHIEAETNGQHFTNNIFKHAILMKMIVF